MQNSLLDCAPAVLPGFEGPEKKLEIDFFFNSPSNQKSKGFRVLDKEQWQSRVLDKAKCTIISVTSNKYLDSYVLSESSLFVYPTKVMIKTCGTTTLLNAVEPLLQIAKELDMSVLHVIFSRKNFNFPHVQPAPHRSFEEECQLLDKFFDGHQYVIGPMNQDHYNLYVADYSDVAHHHIYKPEATIEIMMHDLCPKKMKQFYKNPETFKSAMDVTEKSGIASILPNSIIDPFQFDPCGYSMNGLFGEAYWTIHITPEPHCSYVSFETNCHPGAFGKKTAEEFYGWLVDNVCKVFKPGRATITLFADDAVPQICKERKTAACFDEINNKLSGRFFFKNKSMYEFDRCNLSFCNLSKKEKKVEPKPKQPAVTIQTIAKELGIEIDDIQEGKKKINQQNIERAQSILQV